MRASNKIRFIRAVISGELVLSNRKRADIEADLEAQGYDKMAKSKDVGTLKHMPPLVLHADRSFLNLFGN